ncbi:MAG: IS110 family transposase, partial [Nocardioides sp.]
MTIVAHKYPYVIGVDTHAKTHALAILAAETGAMVGEGQFPATASGMARAIEWVARRTGADLAALWVIEGVASYGALLAGQVTTAGYQVIEAARMDARAHRGVGKSDPLDARRIGAAVLPLDLTQLRHPRADHGIRAALRVLIAARDHVSAGRTAAVNALTALLRVIDLGVDARKPLSGTQISEIAHWRTRQGEEISAATARAEAIRLAKQITSFNTELTTNKARIDKLVQASPAAPLLDKVGIGPITAAIVMTAWSHQGRLRSEAAFAALAGVNPIPASSGNTTRHRLNRGGDRRLNRALH